MKQPEKIMACIDLSQYSPMTLGYALDIANGADLKVTAYSVVNHRDVQPVHIVSVMYPYQVDTEAQIDKLKEHQKAQVKQLIQTWFPEQVDKIDIRIGVGYPAREIIRAVNDLNPDLVVMANKGRGNLSRFMFGSAAEKVFHSCPVPLISVREKTMFRRHHPVKAQPSAHKIETILVAVDFSPWTDEILAYAGWLAQTSGARLCIVNCIGQNELNWVKTHYTPSEGFSLDRFVAGEKERRHQMIIDRVAGLGLEGLPDLKVSIDSGTPLELILDAVDAEEAGMLVLGPRAGSRSGGFIPGSTSEKLFRHCPVPVVRLSPEFKKE